MENFNKELIRNVKLSQADDDEDAYEEKYSFIRYVFSSIESISMDDIELCPEEFEQLNANVDGYFYDEDSQVYNLYIAIYNDDIDDNAFLSKEVVDSYYAKIINFITKTINGKYSDFGESSFTYEIANEIHGLLKQIEIVVNIVSNYNIPPAYKKDDIVDIEQQRISFRTYDLDDLKSKFNQLTSENVVLDCTKSFGEEIEALTITSTVDFDVYLFSMKGEWLANLYKQDSARLLEQNVRSYLKRTAKVNAGILETVKSGPEQFVSFNNGISAVATSVTVSKNNGFSKIAKIQQISNFQIVNGGQTTATLYECLKDKLTDELKSVIVPVKLTVVKNVGNAENFIRNISVFSNTQTAIKKSDPPSNLPYYIQIKKLSQECISSDGENNYICYFERTNGEYQTELRRNNASKKFTNTNPKAKKFDKIDLARAINCWEQVPYITCQGREKNFSYFNDIVKNQLDQPNDEYFKNAYAVVILYKKLDNLAKKMKLSVKSNVVCHTIGLISYLHDKHLNLQEVWDKKDLTPYIYDLALNLLPKVNHVIDDKDPAHPEARMWARKPECWEKVKKISCDKDILKSSNKAEFFSKNDALSFISSQENFFNSLTWTKLLIWNGKHRVLSKYQIGIVKMMTYSAETKTLTKKQKDFLTDTFIAAVKSGYSYK